MDANEKPVTRSTLQKLLDGLSTMTGQAIKAESQRLEKRLEAAEAEIRHGHQRIKALEARHE